MRYDGKAAIERVHALFDDLVAYCMRADAVRGATDSEIAAMAHALGCRTIPVAVCAMLHLIGRDSGPFFGGAMFGVRYLSAADKAAALRYFADVDRPSPEFRDPGGMLVLLHHGGYQTCVVDGADLHLADPPVWLLGEDELQRLWARTTDWFAGECDGVKLYFDTTAEARAAGRRPSGERYFR